MRVSLINSSKNKLSLFFILLLLLSLSSCSDSTGNDSLEQFTGAHTRVVWIQEQGTGVDTFGFGPNFKLMGYDSRDGKQERELVSEIQNFYKPIFSPDGKNVVVSSRSRHEIYLVDFKKRKKKLLGKGVAVDVWEDPATGKIWVYALSGKGSENKYLTTRPLIRFPLKEPKNRELVWKKTKLSWSNFDLSRNGKFAGGLFPWPHAGILLFEQNTWKKYGKGCWTALSPDNSGILWVFDGLHRNLNFVNSFTSESWTTNIGQASGTGGFEVYHPRWSNHISFMTMTGPYVEGEGGNKINEGGQKVEIYVGKFSSDLKSVEGWFQVSHNDLADFYPDVWVANGKNSNFAVNHAKETPTAIEGESITWPGTSEKLVFLWQDVMAENKLDDKSIIGFSQFRVTPKYRAHFNRFLEMNFNGSGFVTSLPQKEILTALQKEDGIGIEFLYTPLSTTSRDEGYIVRLQDKGNNNFISVSQKGTSLQLEIFSRSKMISSFEISDILHEDSPKHIFIDLQGNQLKLHVNGILKKQMSLPVRPLSKLQGIQPLFGNPDAAGKKLNGALSHIAIYAGPNSNSDIAKKAHMVTGGIEARKVAKSVRFKGKVTEISTIPPPDSLGAYSRALVVNRYRVEKVTEGSYANDEIFVAQWAVLDRTILPETKEFQVGKTMELEVEMFDQHPELEGERLMMDVFDPDLEIYYQVSP